MTRADHTWWRVQRMRLFIRQGVAICFFLFWIIALSGAEIATPKKVVDPDLPDATLQPAAQARSLAMLSQVVMQLEHYVQSKDLSAIHNEDVILSAAASELLAQADIVASSQSGDFKTSLTTFCSRVSALHLAADLNQQANSETELGRVLESFSKVKAHFSKEVIAAAQAYLETFTCPMHRDVVGKRTDFCPKCGMALDQLSRVLPSNSGFPLPGQQTVRASVRTAGPLTVGQPVVALLQLQRPNGDHVSPADLIETHTKKIHLLIVDSSLTDYHHEHPVPTRNPGEYSFGFIPGKPGSYRVWADVRPYPLGLQEYAMTDIPATTAGKPLTNRAISFKTTVDGLNYELILAQKTIQVGRPALARLRITNADGKGFTQLEPLMATFAHLVGFNQDYKTVMHMHPKGALVLDPAARGGPELEFQIYALRPGFVRLFAQVQIEGRSRFAPFGLQIAP
jgi:heavy metal-binding protein